MPKIRRRYIVSYFMLKYSLYLHLGAHYLGALVVSIKIDYTKNA